jgi:HSP20 family protein
MDTDIETIREDWSAGVWDWFESPDLGRWFEGLRPFLRDDDRLRIEQELTDDDTMTIRAEIPGIDPVKDVEITVDDGVLSIRADRRYEKKEEQAGLYRSEFRYGSFTRSVRVPKYMDPDDVRASYKDGILEVTFPFKVPTEAEPRKVPVNRS